MKWLAIIVGIPLGLVIVAAIALLIAGAGKDSNRLRGSIVIHRPAAEVWPWLYESDRLVRWVSWLKEVRRAPGEPEVGKPAVWVMEDRNNGNGSSMQFKSLPRKVERNRYLEVELESTMAFNGEASYTLTDLGNGSTRLDTDSRYVFASPFAKLMTPLVVWQASKKMNADFAQLRTQLESSATP